MTGSVRSSVRQSSPPFRVAGRALHDVPPEVEAPDPGPRDVDLLDRSLPDVADPEVAGRPVEADAPRIAQTGQPDLRAGFTVLSCEWVVDREVVGGLGAGVDVDIEAEHLGQERVEMPPGVERIASATAVSGRDVQEPVRPEREAAAVVVAEPIGHLQHDHLAVGVGPVADRPRSCGTRRRPGRRRGPCSTRRTRPSAASGWKARPSRPRSPPAVMQSVMSRNGSSDRAARRGRCGSGPPARPRTASRGRPARQAMSTGLSRPPTTGSSASWGGVADAAERSRRAGAGVTERARLW